ncbi:hypothetical protein C8A05DRAFT_16608 [Staphylotrichum tortipilum]|uniref:Uncharacterized protein n=1 Tax=Staphylotrichum tortipilum TaxID=2831512 RepID=A0AAN6MJ89_9PEZI|nr:hypothetical protein C8A05DRAFT_16608 [Staphylotrichum longicolle]
MANTDNADTKETIKSKEDVGAKEDAADTKQGIRERNKSTKEKVADANEVTKKQVANADEDGAEAEEDAAESNDVADTKGAAVTEGAAENKEAAESNDVADSNDTVDSGQDVPDRADTTDDTVSQIDSTNTLPTTIPPPIPKPPLPPSPSTKPLASLSARRYSVRATDPSDFAYCWEITMIPWLDDKVLKHWRGDISFDVHAFQCPTTGAVLKRVMIISFSFDAVADGNKEAARGLEHTLSAGLVKLVPAEFKPFDLDIHHCRGSGGVGRDSWWGGQAATDQVCDPQHTTFYHTPVMGMSIGPNGIDYAATMGGYVRVGSKVYGMTAAHAFEGLGLAPSVMHPAQRDVRAGGRAAYRVGQVARSVGPRAPRESATFEGMNMRADEKRVEMDFLQTGASIEVGDVIAVHGNAEVYSMARTSGYSLGFTSEVPGMQRINGQRTREWTVRQHAPVDRPNGGGRWQTVRQWVTSGMGVLGDSGAWLMRRSDNGVMGLIWARNHNQGDPREQERVRLTYFTPMVDILAEIRENYARRKAVSLLRGSPSTGSSARAVPLSIAEDPWSEYSWESIRGYRDALEDRIYGGF